MSNPFMGEVRMFSFSFAPRGWAACDGQLLLIKQNQALYALIGTMYGGDGLSTFALPDLRGRAPVHRQTGSVPQGQSGGEEAHVLTVAEMGPHAHPVNANSQPPNAGTPQNNTWSAQTANAYAMAPNSQMNLGSIQPAGGGQGHPNMQPYLVGCYCIALSGIFPSRS